MAILNSNQILCSVINIYLFYFFLILYTSFFKKFGFKQLSTHLNYRIFSTDCEIFFIIQVCNFEKRIQVLQQYMCHNIVIYYMYLVDKDAIGRQRRKSTPNMVTPTEGQMSRPIRDAEFTTNTNQVKMLF